MEAPQARFRSISLPSRLQPSAPFEAEVNVMKSWFSKAVPVSSDLIQSGLLKLAQLYTSVENLARFPTTQQAGKPLEETLSTSVEVLDSCTAVRELVQMIQESIQALQSALRRKGLDSRPIQADVALYFSIRKKMNRSIAKSLKALNKLENKNGSSSPSMHEGDNFIPRLREITGLTIAILRSTLMFLSWMDSKPCAWNLVSKLMMLTKPAASGAVGEVGCVDLALDAFQLMRARSSSDNTKVFDVQMLQRSLGNVGACAEGIETGLERLFRQLVRVRVTLLNILTDH